jgi:hypothetical protein
MEAFSQQQHLRFEDEMLAHLRREYGHVLGRRDDAWVREMIRVGIDQAAEYDIVLERDVARYLELMLVLSPDFDDSDETPWGRNILTDASLSAEEKLDRICEFVLFGEQPRESIQGSKGGVPRPFHRDAARAADSRIRTEYPGIDPTRLTMDAADCEYRQAWMSTYHQSLADLAVPPITSRPDAEVGAPVAEGPASATGSLTVTLIDAETDRPVVAASVQISGPVVERAVSSFSGRAEFQGIATGAYEVFAIDAQHRLGRGKATVKQGQTQVSLSCRHASGVSAAP